MSTPPAAAPRPDIPWNPPPSTSERRARGREARQRVPRRDLGRLTVEGRDPLGILEAQNATRIPELVPLRIERMSATPFAFYRGAAAVMAADLARDPSTPIHVASCGDAHVANFGFYASPQRTLVFDLNDFDETLPGPFEWDVKRLAASVTIACRHNGFDEADGARATRAAVRGYRKQMADAEQRSPLELQYHRLEVDQLINQLGDRRSRKVASGNSA